MPYNETIVLTLSTPVQYIPRVGPARAKLLSKLGIATVRDLIYYIPFRYDDFSIISPIAHVQAGETVTIGGTVTAFHSAITKSGKKLQEMKIADDSGELDVIWFNQPFLERVLPSGTPVRLAGKIDWFGHKLVMTSPSYEVTALLPANHESLHTGRLVPVYPETEGLSSKWLRGRIAFALQEVLKDVVDTLPNYDLMPLNHAITAVHFPKTKEEALVARRRLAFDELFFLQLRAWKERRLWQETKKSHQCRINDNEINTLIRSLPFSLTNDQQSATNEILLDLDRTYPMNRLLEGDVGAGKTVVAMIAMFAVHRNNLQSVLMAPTQVLAEQHYRSIKGFLAPYGVSVSLVTGNRIGNHESRINDDLREKRSYDSKFMIPDSEILIGTHALLSNKITLNNLGLVVIDEQQRFGVAQRSALLETTKKKQMPHILTMTATPIPRTVAKVAIGNLDLSVLTVIPEGRKKIKTWVVPNEKREGAYAWITKQIRDIGGQAFIICPLIEESETLATAKAATTEYKRLTMIFPELKLGLLHGRMKPREKNESLDAFRKGETQILVATPVVEVGIDIPSATVMLIEAADRFGLSQLHQLRGRVGRGERQSYCLLFTDATEEMTISRLKAMETTHSGPLLAELDLAIRGPGELFGTRQHGIPELKIARWSDAELIAQAQEAVRHITGQDPDLASFSHLREKLKESTIITSIGSI